MDIGRKFLKLFFVVFFSLYSVSPLTYSLSDDSDALLNPITHGAKGAIESFNILYLDMLFSKLTGGQGTSAENSDEDHMLIKKSRAVLRSSGANPTALSQQDCAVTTTAVFVPLADVTYKASIDVPQLSAVFISTYSGLSPPSA